MDLAALYQKAQNDPKYRQEFLQMMPLGRFKKFIRRVVYANEKGDALMKAHCAMFHRKVSIIVFMNAFRLCFADFQAVLCNHEGYHAYQLVQRGFRDRLRSELPGSYADVYGRLLVEVSAYKYEVSRLTGANSEAFCRECRQKLQKAMQLTQNAREKAIQEGEGREVEKYDAMNWVR